MAFVLDGDVTALSVCVYTQRAFGGPKVFYSSKSLRDQLHPEGDWWSERKTDLIQSNTMRKEQL